MSHAERTHPPLAEYWLWFATMGPPVAFMLNLEISYAIVEWACASGATICLHLVPLIFLIICGLAFLAARRGRVEGEAIRITQRRELMSKVGSWGAGLFGLAILAQWIATFFIDPCVR